MNLCRKCQFQPWNTTFYCGLLLDSTSTSICRILVSKWVKFAFLSQIRLGRDHALFWTFLLEIYIIFQILDIIVVILVGIICSTSKSQGCRFPPICIMDMHYGYKHHGYMHHGYKHHGYNHHGYIYHRFMYPTPRIGLSVCPLVRHEKIPHQRYMHEGPGSWI